MLLGARIDDGLSTAFAAETASPQSYAPGTYTAGAEGKGGKVVVETTFSQNAIEEVKVVSHEETKFLSDMAIGRIPQLIVEKQSLGIDTITGSTLTSSAIINAVADCVEQAEGSVDALRAKPANTTTEETSTVEIDADVVIAGAGAAGMAAAVAAAQSGAQKVIVLEKTSNMGGNALVSGGWLRFIYAPQDLRPEMTDGYVEYFDSLLKQAKDGGVDSALLDWIRADYDAYYAKGYQTTYASNQLNNLELRVVNQLGFEGYTDATTDIPYDERYEKSQDTRTKLNRWLDSMGIEWIPIEAIVGYPWPQWTGVKGQHCGDGYFSLFSKEIGRVPSHRTRSPHACK